jgi:hypothetical protein
MLQDAVPLNPGSPVRQLPGLKAEPGDVQN